MSNSKGSLETLMTGHSLGQYDRRKKLTDDQKEEIKLMYKDGMGVREIARKFEGTCSRRLIQFVIFPERLIQLQERNRLNEHWKKYHKKEELTKAVRSWRRYKKQLFKDKKI